MEFVGLNFSVTYSEKNNSKIVEESQTLFPFPSLPWESKISIKGKKPKQILDLKK